MGRYNIRTKYPRRINSSRIVNFRAIRRVINRHTYTSGSLVRVLLGTNTNRRPVRRFLNRVFFKSIYRYLYSLSLYYKYYTTPSCTITQFPTCEAPAFQGRTRGFDYRLVRNPHISPAVISTVHMNTITREVFVHNVGRQRWDWRRCGVLVYMRGGGTVR